MPDQQSEANPRGLLIHWATRYDLLVWLLTLGRERAFRDKLVKLARLTSGESVLDVGCGTGTLAIAAKRQVGTTGSVTGIDASPQMVTRAAMKARKAGVLVRFQIGPAQNLPFPDAQFDAATMTVMLHHLPRKAREECIREVRRVLKPGGRVLAVDFGGSAGDRKDIVAHFHRHGKIAPAELMALLSQADLRVIESGRVGVSDLHYVLAVAPGGPL